MCMKRIDEKEKVICKFDGKMNTIACNEINDELTAILEECAASQPVISVEFDLDGVEYIASSFLRLCGKAAQKLGTQNLSVVNVTPLVKKVFKIAGLADSLLIS